MARTLSRAPRQTGSQDGSGAVSSVASPRTSSIGASPRTAEELFGREPRRRQQFCRQSVQGDGVPGGDASAEAAQHAQPVLELGFVLQGRPWPTAPPLEGHTGPGRELLGRPSTEHLGTRRQRPSWRGCRTPGRREGGRLAASPRKPGTPIHPRAHASFDQPSKSTSSGPSPRWATARKRATRAARGRRGRGREAPRDDRSAGTDRWRPRGDSCPAAPRRLAVFVAGHLVAGRVRHRSPSLTRLSPSVRKARQRPAGSDPAPASDAVSTPLKGAFRARPRRAARPPRAPGTRTARPRRRRPAKIRR